MQHGEHHPKLPAINSLRSSFLTPETSFGIKSATQYPADPSLPIQVVSVPDSFACAEGNLSSESNNRWSKAPDLDIGRVTIACHGNYVLF